MASEIYTSPVHQQFLENIHFNGTTYGIRALLIGNFIGPECAEKNDVIEFIVANYFEDGIEDAALEQLKKIIFEIWNDTEEVIERNTLPLMSPVHITAETEDILDSLMTRQEEISCLLSGLDIAQFFAQDNDEYDDIGNNLEQFIDECDDLFIDIEDAEDMEDYRHDMLAMIEESEDIWNDTLSDD